MKIKWLIALVSVLIVANIALVAYIWLKKDVSDKPPQSSFDARDYLVKSLSLNEAQTKSFDSLRSIHFKHIRGYRDNMHQLKDELFNQLKLPQHSRTDSLAIMIGKLQTQIDIETFNHFYQMRLLLNSEQKLKFDGTIQEVLRSMAPRPGRLNHRAPPGRKNDPPEHRILPHEDKPPQ